jgi:hypothetical protein
LHDNKSVHKINEPPRGNMKKTRRILLFIFVIICLTCLSVFNCASVQKSSINFNPEIDCPDKDYANFDFDSFQKQNANSSRSIELIKAKINLKRDKLIDLFESNYKKKLFKMKYYLFFHINTQGNFSCLVDSLDPPNDSIFLNMVQNILKDIKLDSLPTNNSVAKIHGIINFSRNPPDFILSDTVLFYPMRSKKSIMCVVYPNLKPMRYLYNRYLHEAGLFKGKITVKFAINEYGKVIFAKVIENTTKNDNFANEELELIKGWVFPKLNNPRDVTEVIYPFIFAY